MLNSTLHPSNATVILTTIVTFTVFAMYINLFKPTQSPLAKVITRVFIIILVQLTVCTIVDSFTFLSKYLLALPSIEVLFFNATTQFNYSW